VVEHDERDMIHSVFALGDTIAREVMVPRTDMVWVEDRKSASQALTLALRSGFSRLPVIGENVDDVLGVAYLKDLVRHTQTGAADTVVAEVMRPATYVPESKHVDELLREMQAARTHMAIVVDEYGGTAGLVTLEDLLEEIVGEIRDEYDSAEEDQLVILNDHEARVDAGFPLEELNSRLGLAIEESGDYDSVGGYVHSVLGKIAQPGDSFKGGRARWTVEKVKGRRIVTIRLTADQPWPTDALIASGIAHPSQSNEDDSTNQPTREKESGHIPLPGGGAAQA